MGGNAFSNQVLSPVEFDVIKHVDGCRQSVVVT